MIPQRLAGFDVSAAVERMLDQPALWWQAMALFVDHFEHWEAGWLASIGDDQSERRQVHALGSAAANIGAIDLERCARDLEAALMERLKHGNCSVDPALRTRLAQAFRSSWGGADQARREGGQSV